MARTPEQYAALAKFAGGKLDDKMYKIHKSNSPFWDFGSMRASVLMWRPDSNPAHIMLMLGALAKRMGWFSALTVLTLESRNDNNYDFGDAICNAAEAVMDKERSVGDGKE